MRLLIPFLILSCFSCEKLPEQYTNLNGGQIDIIGHGGGGEQNFQNPHPWNSWKSIEYGLARDVDGIEIDVQLSADSVLFLYHDEYLSPETNCNDCVSSHSSRELKNCAQKAGFFGASDSHPLMSLDELRLRLLSLDTQPRVCLNVRVNDACDNWLVYPQLFYLYASKLAAFSQAYPNTDITTPDINLLIRLSELDLPAALYLDGHFENGNADIDFASSFGLDGLVVEWEDVSAEEVATIHAAGLKVIFYGPFDVFSHRQALQRSPDGIITDNITLLRELLSR